MDTETGLEAKQRLLLEAAAKGEFGLKLCERHHYTHIEGSLECILQSLKEFHLYFSDQETLWLEGY